MKHRLDPVPGGTAVLTSLLILFAAAGAARGGTIGRELQGDPIWTTLGTGFDGDVYALAHGNGKLYAGGLFTEAGGAPAASIAMWDGAAWTNLGAGVDGDISTLLLVGDRLYAGGTFTTAGGVPAANIAMWDGAAWTNLGAGFSDEINAPSVYALAHDGTNLYAGGWFTWAGETNANYVARWDGVAWTNLAEGIAGSEPGVYALSVVGTNLFAGGLFETAGQTNASNIARWDGVEWTPVDGSLNGCIYAFARDDDVLYAGGLFNLADTAGATNVAAWSAAVGWTNLYSGVNDNDAIYEGYVIALAICGGRLYAGGFFDRAGDVQANHIAAWDGAAWTNLAEGIDLANPDPETHYLPSVNALATDGTNLFAGGLFTSAGATPANNIAAWGPEKLEDYGVTPRIGSWVGGAVIVLTGSDFGNGSDVTNITLCGISAAIQSQSPTQIVVVAGASPDARIGDVRIFSASLGESAKTNAFAYRIPGFQLRNAAGTPIASGASASSANGTAFGTRYIGQTVTNHFTIVNTGDIELTLGDAALVGIGASHFAIVDLATTIPPGGSDDFGVVFSPSAKGRFYPSARLDNDSPTTPFVINLSGRGIAYAPEIDPPESLAASTGDTVALEPAVFGGEPLHFQWMKNGTAVAGATSATLVLANASAADSGLYQLVATNASGMALSRPARVAIAPARLLVWGDNASGQLGTGTSGDDATNALDSGSAAVFAAAGATHSAFLDATGTLHAAGDNANGQLGDGTTTPRLSPVALSSPADLVGVAAGQEHTLMLGADGALYAAGANANGQLGDFSTTPRSTPVQVWSGYDVVAASAGAAHTLFIKDNGTLYATGLNDDGQLGIGSRTSRSDPATAASRVVAVAAGGFHSLFVKDDGTLWAMGDNAFGQLGDGTLLDRLNEVAIAQDVAGIAAGYRHSLFVKRDGTLWGMGLNDDGQLGTGDTSSASNAVFIASNVVCAAAGKNHSLYQTADGSVWAMGGNADGQLGGVWPSPCLAPVRVPCLSLAAALSGPAAAHTLAIGSRLPPEISAHPVGQSVVHGDPAGFSVAAVGFEPLFYQWRLDSAALEGETASNLVIAAAVFADAGSYDVIVSNAIGAVFSAAATLEVRQATPQVATWPTASGIVYGQTLAGSTLSGGGASVPGTFAFAAPATKPAAGVAAHAVVFFPEDPIIYVSVTGAVDVAVAQATPEIFAWPTATPLTYGQSLHESTLGNGWASTTGTFAFVNPDDTPDIGTASHSVVFSPVDAANFLAVTGSVSVAVGKATPTVSTWPESSPLYRGQTLAESTLSGGNASVAGSFAFTTPTLKPDIGNAPQAVRFTPDDITHYLTVDDAVAVLVVSALEIETGPTNVSAQAGASFELGVSATGAQPIGYQWYRNGAPISGATQATLALDNPSMDDTGLYQVLATNALSLRLSVPARVAVDAPPLLGWGENASGQLGDGSVVDHLEPEFVAADVVAAAAGAAHSIFLRADGTLRAMGANLNGQLGDGTPSTRHTPVQVVGGSNVVAIAAGASHSLFLTADGSLRGVGANADGQLATGDTLPRATSVLVAEGVRAFAAGASHTLFVDAAGQLHAAGANADGQLGDGTTIPRTPAVSVPDGDDVAAVAAGSTHTLFIAADGDVRAMGANVSGQLGNGGTAPSLAPVVVSNVVLVAAAPGATASHTLAIGLRLYDFAYAKLPDGTVAITGYAGAGGAVAIPAALNGMAVSRIADAAFLGCATITAITLPDTVGDVDAEAFADCVALTNVVFGGGVTNLGAEAFANCPALAHLAIPAGLTQIGSGAFWLCTGLQDITVAPGNPAFLVLDGVLYDKDVSTLLLFPAGHGGACAIPEGVDRVASGAFAGAADLTNVTLPATLVSIGDYAFENCTNLVALYFHGDAPSAGTDVFLGATGVAYHSPAASGWGETYAGIPACPWNASVLADGSLGLRDGLFGFTLSGATGMMVVVEAADDLVEPVWTPVSTQSLVNGVADFEDPDTSQRPSRFYRLRMP